MISVLLVKSFSFNWLRIFALLSSRMLYLRVGAKMETSHFFPFFTLGFSGAADVT